MKNLEEQKLLSFIDNIQVITMKLKAKNMPEAILNYQNLLLDLSLIDTKYIYIKQRKEAIC